MPSKLFQLFALLVATIITMMAIAVMGIDLLPTSIPGFGA